MIFATFLRKHISLILLLLGALIFPVSLIAAGSVQTYNQQNSEVVVRTDGQIMTEVRENERIYIGGLFHTVQLNDTDVVERFNLAELNLTTQQVHSWSPEPDQAVEALRVTDDAIYVGGRFQAIGGEKRQYLASFDKQSHIISDVKLNIEDGAVFALEHDLTTLYFGGAFTKINGLDRVRLASVDVTNNGLSEWTPEVNGDVLALKADQGVLYVGGRFTQVNGQPRTNVAAFDLASGQLLPWNPQINIIVRSIEIRDTGIALIGYQSTSENTYQQQTVIVSPSTGEIVETIATTDYVAPIPNVTGTYIGNPQSTVAADQAVTNQTGLSIDIASLGFKIPTLGDVLTFVIRIFFVLGGLAALFYMLLGAFSWITSGGDKDAVGAARDKIQAAVVGVLMIVAVLAVVWTLEQVIFKRRICLGLSCPLTIPSLLEPSQQSN
ncbi:MAG: hypothetical protein ACEQSA_02490 [Weeksellaceae bacterium]